MSLTHKTTHLAEAKARLVEQFKSKARLEALLGGFVSQTQDLEDVLEQLYLSRWLDTAAGLQLDGLGQLLGEPRAGKDDATYRTFLAVRLVINLSSGLAEELLAVATKVIGANAIQLIEEYPSALTLKVAGTLAPGVAALAEGLLKSTAAGGVRVALEWASREPTFAFDGAPGVIGGFSSIGSWSLVDGKFAGTAVRRIKAANGVLFALGDAGACSTSVDGTTWTLRTVGAANLVDVAFGAGVWVILGENNNAYYSSDLATWNSIDPKMGGAGGNGKTIIFGGGLFVAVGVNGLSPQASTSPDGITFTARTLPVMGGTGQYRGAAYGNGAWVILGCLTSGKIARSTNGVDWLAWDIPASWQGTDISFADGLFVAAGRWGYAAYSADGTVWTKVSTGVPGDFIRMTRGASRWVAVGTSGSIGWSDDGMTWHSASGGVSTQLNDVSAGTGNEFRAVGASGKTVASADGESWFPQPTAFGADSVAAVGSIGGVFVAGSSAGAKVMAKSDSVAADAGTFAEVEV